MRIAKEAGVELLVVDEDEDVDEVGEESGGVEELDPLPVEEEEEEAEEGEEEEECSETLPLALFKPLAE